MLIIISRTDNNCFINFQTDSGDITEQTIGFTVNDYEFRKIGERYEFYPITGQLGSSPTISKQPKASFPAEHTIVYDNRTFENPDPT